MGGCLWSGVELSFGKAVREDLYRRRAEEFYKKFLPSIIGRVYRSSRHPSSRYSIVGNMGAHRKKGGVKFERRYFIYDKCGKISFDTHLEAVSFGLCVMVKKLDEFGGGEPTLEEILNEWNPFEII